MNYANNMTVAQELVDKYRTLLSIDNIVNELLSDIGTSVCEKKDFHGSIMAAMIEILYRKPGCDQDIAELRQLFESYALMLQSMFTPDYLMSSVIKFQQWNLFQQIEGNILEIVDYLN